MKTEVEYLQNENNTFENKTCECVFKMNRIFYLCGLNNYLDVGTRLPTSVVKIYEFISKCEILTILNIILFLSDWAALFTQKSLPDKKRSVLIQHSIGHPFFLVFCASIKYHKNDIKVLLHNLTIKLKKNYNDPDIERDLIKKCDAAFVFIVVIISSAFVSQVLEGIISVITSEGPFSPAITFWPDYYETGKLADLIRVVFFFIWFILAIRLSAVYLLTVLLISGMSFQLKNLQSYFKSLGNIFKEEDLSQVEKEAKYEKAFKVGVKVHADTLKCINLIQKSCGVVFDAQIFMCMAFNVLSLNHMMNEEQTFANLFAQMCIELLSFITTAFIMWNAGDITVEASIMPKAVYSSGWENCEKHASRRIRSLVTLTMLNCQRRVLLTSFGIIELSYETYVAIFKTSYSLFTMIYSR